MIDLFEKCRKPSLAGELKEKGIYPYFHALESRQAPEVIMEGKRRIMLGSNNYLGLTTCQEVRLPLSQRHTGNAPGAGGGAGQIPA